MGRLFRLREGNHLAFHARDGLTPLPRDSWRGRLPTGTMVNVLLRALEAASPSLTSDELKCVATWPP
jgi:hypothetical protein